MRHLQTIEYRVVFFSSPSRKELMFVGGFYHLSEKKCSEVGTFDWKDGFEQFYDSFRLGQMMGRVTCDGGDGMCMFIRVTRLPL